MKKITLLLGLFLSLFTFFCCTEDSTINEDNLHEQSLRFSYATVDIDEGPPIWDNPKHIPFCWEKLDEENQYQAMSPVQPTKENISRVEKVITEQFAKAGINFVSKGPCQSWSKWLNNDGIRIKINYYPGQSRTEGFGKELNGKKNGMILNWAIKDDVENNIMAIDRITNTALHEFGHALGLRHEMTRPDHTNCSDKDYTMGWGELDNAQSLGDYIPDSFMSYCRDLGATELSKADIAAIKNYCFNPIAVIANGPRGIKNLTEIDFVIGGNDIEGYRYKIGQAHDIDCKNSVGYSEEQLVSEKISADLKPFGDNPVKLCVIGKNIEQKWQKFEAYTSWYWIQDLTPPSPGAFNKSDDENKLKIYLDEESITFASYKYGQDIDCSEPEGYGDMKPYEEVYTFLGTQNTIVYPIKIDLTSESFDQRKNLIVCIVAKDNANNVQSFDQATVFVHSFMGVEPYYNEKPIIRNREQKRKKPGKYTYKLF